MKKIEIEKSRPILPRSKYPFPDLKVGNSFSTGKYNTDMHRNLNSLAAYYTKKLGFIFTIRCDDNNCLRVWRIK